MTISTFERNATIAEMADGGPPYRFDRYINGQRMAEGVLIEREKTLEAAMKAAARIASRGRNGEVPVLVLDATAVLAAARAVPADVVLETTAEERRAWSRLEQAIAARCSRDIETLTAALAASTARERAKDAEIERLRGALTDAKDRGLIYWEPQTGRGRIAKGQMLVRIDAALSGRKPDTKEGTTPEDFDLRAKFAADALDRYLPDPTRDRAVTMSIAGNVLFAAGVRPTPPEAQ